MTCSWLIPLEVFLTSRSKQSIKSRVPRVPGVNQFPFQVTLGGLGDLGTSLLEAVFSKHLNQGILIEFLITPDDFFEKNLQIICLKLRKSHLNQTNPMGQHSRGSQFDRAPDSPLLFHRNGFQRNGSTTETSGVETVVEGLV